MQTIACRPDNKIKIKVYRNGNLVQDEDRTADRKEMIRAKDLERKWMQDWPRCEIVVIVEVPDRGRYQGETGAAGIRGVKTRPRFERCGVGRY